MPLLGRAAVAMWWDMAPAMRAEFEDWHSHEHFPERMGIPGFMRGSRWASSSGGEGFFVIYELDAYETLTSPHYLARLNSPTPWSAKMMPHHRNMVRSQCRLLESYGSGIANAIMTLRLSPLADRADALRGYLQDRLSELPALPGITGAHLLQTETPQAAATTEQRIRGGDGVADWIVLVSGYDAAALQDIAAKVFDTTSLAGAGAGPSTTVGLYDLSYTLSKSDLGM